MESVSSVRRSPLVTRLRSYVAGCVRIDTRTLAAFRIGAALLILADLVLRSRNFVIFYTDDGVVPQSLAMEAAPIAVPGIYHLATGPATTAALFVLHGLIAVQLLVGYKTRLATVLSFLFVLSLDLRNPLVLSYADVLFAWLLLWAIFLPLGDRWSVDAVHADREPRGAVAGIGSALILLQMVTMYVVNGYHKSQSELWTSGEAAVLVLGLDDTTFLFGDLVRAVPTALQYGGLTWYYMLLFAWALLLARGRVRTALVGAFVAVHLSFGLTVRIGAFPYVAIAGVALFLQASFWDDLRRVAVRIGVPVTEISARRSRLIDVATALPRLRAPFGLGRAIDREPRKAAASVLVAAVLLVALVSALSAGGLVENEVDPVDGTEQAATAFVDHQTEWSIFAPTPRTTDRYHVFPARTADGELVDVYNERELSYERPGDELQQQFGTYRERFYMTYLAANEPESTPEELAEHLCESWETDEGDAITHINMYQVTEDVTIETIDAPSERERSATEFYRHGCGDNEPMAIDPPPF
ncbi:HTTM domain-containing protein [Natrialbaceae archaeon A-arb3/5]